MTVEDIAGYVVLFVGIVAIGVCVYYCYTYNPPKK